MRRWLLCFAFLLSVPGWASAQARNQTMTDPNGCPGGTEAIMAGGGSCAPCAAPRPGEPPRSCPCSPPVFECVPSGRVQRWRSQGGLGGGRVDEAADHRRLCEAARTSVGRYHETVAVVDALRRGCASAVQRSVMEPLELHARLEGARNDAQLRRVVRELPRTNPRVACQLSRTCFGNLRSLAVSPDGNWLASTSATTVTLWRLRDRRRVHVLSGHQNEVLHVAFTPDSSVLASSAYHDDVRLWSTTSGQPLGAVRTGDLNNAIAFARDGGGASSFVLVTTGINGPLRTWRVPGRSALASSTERFASQTAAGSPVAPIVYASSRLWDPRTGTVLHAIDNQRGGHGASAFSPDGSLLATGGGSANAGQDYGVRLFDVATGQPRRVLVGHQRSVQSVAFSPDGRTIVSADARGEIRIWDVRTGASVGRVSVSQSVQTLVFLPDGRRFLSGAADGAIRTHRVPSR